MDMLRSLDRQFRPLDHSGRKRALVVSSGMVLLLLSTTSTTPARNVILFVADGLRQGSVNNDDAPAMNQIRKKGVFFANSHALFPTLTTPNASAIATGHNLGDTGDFGNYLYTGFPLPAVGDTQVPFVKNDRVLGTLDERFGGNYLHEETLISFAANTAITRRSSASWAQSLFRTCRRRTRWAAFFLCRRPHHRRLDRQKRRHTARS
jgi:hypothetical protein